MYLAIVKRFKKAFTARFLREEWAVRNPHINGCGITCCQENGNNIMLPVVIDKKLCFKEEEFREIRLVCQ